MPYINIRTARAPLNVGQRQALVTQTTNLMATLMGKKPELTSVRIEMADPDYWGVGGAIVSQSQSGRAAHMDIKVTAGTNTEQEKAEMIAASQKMLSEVIGILPEATYVVIHDLPAENWGYNGKTQAARAKAMAAA